MAEVVVVETNAQMPQLTRTIETMKSTTTRSISWKRKKRTSSGQLSVAICRTVSDLQALKGIPSMIA